MEIVSNSNTWRWLHPCCEKSDFINWTVSQLIASDPGWRIPGSEPINFQARACRKNRTPFNNKRSPPRSLAHPASHGKSQKRETIRTHTSQAESGSQAAKRALIAPTSSVPCVSLFWPIVFAHMRLTKCKLMRSVISEAAIVFLNATRRTI